MQARARLGLLPALLPAAPAPVAPARALDGLGQHACRAASRELLELPLLPQLAALCVRHAPGQDLHALLSLVNMLPQPELPDRPLCDAEAFVLERYARCMPVPELKYLSGSSLWLSSAGGGSAAARPAAPQLLEHLLLPPFLQPQTSAAPQLRRSPHACQWTCAVGNAARCWRTWQEVLLL